MKPPFGKQNVTKKLKIWKHQRVPLRILCVLRAVLTLVVADSLCSLYVFWYTGGALLLDDVYPAQRRRGDQKYSWGAEDRRVRWEWRRWTEGVLCQVWGHSRRVGGATIQTQTHSNQGVETLQPTTELNTCQGKHKSLLLFLSWNGSVPESEFVSAGQRCFKENQSW